MYIIQRVLIEYVWSLCTPIEYVGELYDVSAPESLKWWTAGVSFEN